MQSSNSLPVPPDQNRGPLVLATSWLTLGIAIIVVLLRLYIRLKRNAHGWDDYTIYLALAICIFGTAADTKQVHLGFGRHANYIEPTLAEAVKWTVITDIQSNIVTGLVKISVCLFILRIIYGVHKTLSRIVIYFMVIMTLGTLAYTFSICFQCIPIMKEWRPDIPGRCISPTIVVDINRGLGAFICLTDLFCSLIPILIFRDLKMPKWTKIGLCLVMGLGVFTAGCSIGQVVTTEYVAADVTWDLVPVEVWSLLQENLGITAASLPALRLLPASIRQLQKYSSERKQYPTRPDVSPNRFDTRVWRGSDTRQQRDSKSAESDAIELVSSKAIEVQRSVDVDFAPRSSGEAVEPRGWERDRV